MINRVPDELRIFLRYLLGGGQCLYAFDDYFKRGPAAANDDDDGRDYTLSPWADGPAHPDPNTGMVQSGAKSHQYEGPYSGPGTPGEASDCYCTGCENRYEKLGTEDKWTHPFYATAWIWDRQRKMDSMISTVNDGTCTTEWKDIKQDRRALHRRRHKFPGTQGISEPDFLKELIKIRDRSDWVIVFVIQQLQIIERNKSRMMR